MAFAKDELINLFKSSILWGKYSLENSFAIAKRGLDTCDVTRWVRYWWETPLDKITLNPSERHSEVVDKACSELPLEIDGWKLKYCQMGVDGERLKG